MNTIVSITLETIEKYSIYQMVINLIMTLIATPTTHVLVVLFVLLMAYLLAREFRKG